MSLADQSVPGSLDHARAPNVSGSRKRPSSPLVSCPLCHDGSFRALPDALPVRKRRQPPGKISAKEAQGLGSGASHCACQADAQSRQVLDPPPLGHGIHQADPDEVDQAQELARFQAVEMDQDVTCLQIAV